MADIHMFEGEDIVETLAAQAEGHEPGELGALAYHLYDTNPELTEEEAFEAFTNWVADRGIELWSPRRWSACWKRRISAP